MQFRHNGVIVYLDEIKLDRGGYDKRGRYYGVGQRLFETYTDLSTTPIQFRAKDFKSAKSTLTGTK